VFASDLLSEKGRRFDQQGSYWRKYVAYYLKRMASIRTKRYACEVASILGIISHKQQDNKGNEYHLKQEEQNVLEPKSNRSERRKEEVMTMAMFTKLLARRRVASRFPICEAILRQLYVGGRFLFRFFLYSAGVREKKADSDPETSPDKIRRRRTTMISMPAERPTG
jgi:hypothetical protein